MKTKIVTLAGYMCLSDERMAENAKSLFKDIIDYKNIEMRNVTDTKTKSYYRVTTPFGCAYTRSYNSVCNINRRNNAENSKRTFEIVTVH